MSGPWESLGRVPPGELSDARLHFHHAAQIVSAVGVTYLPAAADDSHTNMEWTHAGLAGHVVPGTRPFRATIRPSGLTLGLLDESLGVLEETSLFGRTLDEGYAWMAKAIARRTAEPSRPLMRPTYALPDHATYRGEPFRKESAPALDELARWYGNACGLLERLMAVLAGSSPVRTWPHHFDIAMLVMLDGSKSIGVGLSPGDGTFMEPYWYVSPYPYPVDPTLPALPSRGRWHREGFFAAVLRGCDLVGGGPTEGQEARSRAFLEAAIEACRTMLTA